MGGQRDARAAAVQPPPITFHGTRLSSDELAAIAAGWLDFVRADDCFKSGLGHLVNPGMIADVFTSHPGVTDALVIPVGEPGGALIGVVVEAAGAVHLSDLRTAAARELPPWLQPHILKVTPDLPRLAGGKADRDACRSLLREARSGGAGPDAFAPPAA